jgi:Tol biopolymer transport system component
MKMNHRTLRWSVFFSDIVKFYIRNAASNISFNPKASFKKWRISAVATLMALLAFPAPAFSASFIQLVSQRDASLAPVVGGGGSSQMPIVSSDGRYVLFASTANNLTVMSNGLPMSVWPLPSMNVYLRDCASNTTTLVSVNLAGTGGGNGDSLPAGISTNGQFVLFVSAASDLVANDTNNANDVFVRDIVNNITTLVSVSTNGTSGNGESRSPVVTPDGRYVAYVSAATNLVAGDSNGIPDVFVRDLQENTTTLVSVGATSSSPYQNTPSGSSETPEITPDGRYVAFYSTASNLVYGVTTTNEVYVRDLVAGSTVWASASARSIFQSVTGSTNEISCNFSISTNEQYVAFEVCTNPASGAAPAGIILRYNVPSNSIDVICSNAAVPVENFEDIHNLDMTPDGRFVAYVATVGNNSLTNTAIELWDAQTGTNILVSPDQNTGLPANGICDFPVVSTNGRYVAFLSSGTNLTANPLIGDYHLYLRDVQTGSTTLVDADTNGMGSGVSAVTVPSMTGDGSTVAFDAPDGNIVANDRNRDTDIFVRNLPEQTTEMVSDHDPNLPSQTPSGGIAGFTAGSLNTDGRYLAFFSAADNLIPGDTNGCRDVFVRDLMTGTNIPVSLNTNGVTGDGISTDPAISGNGRYVAFTSSADDLVPNDNNNSQDVFVRDLQTGTTTLVSVSTDGVHPGNGNSYSPSISADGRYVLFQSLASNLASGSFGNAQQNLFLRDLQTGTTYALTGGSATGVYAAAMTPDGRYVAFYGSASGISGNRLYVWSSALDMLTYTNNNLAVSTSPDISISPNGQKLACLGNTPGVLYAINVISNTVTTLQPGGPFLVPFAGLQFSGDGRYLTYAVSPSAGFTTNSDVYLYDFQTGTNLLISENPNTLQPANGNSDSPAISADGRFIAYRSAATDLVAGSTNGLPQLIVYDRLANSNSLFSVAATGAASGDNRSMTPEFSPDGRTLVFTSWASNLAADDFNHFSDLFAFEFLYVNVTLGAPGQGPTLTWPYVSGHSYQVEYKNNLTDNAWQQLAGTVNINGNQAWMMDPAPVSSQRFYRVVAQ